jgi:FACT complex subunit SPT16 N-terminal lobe domain
MSLLVSLLSTSIQFHNCALPGVTISRHLIFGVINPAPHSFTADTILMFTKSGVHAIAGSKKVDILKQLEGVCQDAGLTLTLVAKPKKEDGKEQIEELLTAAKATADKAVIGAFVKVASLLNMITALLYS